MRDLQREFGMAILMITHDLGVVANMADEVVVVYHGEVMEAGSADDIFRRLYRQKFDRDAPDDQLSAFTELMTAAGIGRSA